MQIKYVNSSDEPIQEITELINNHLGENKKVLWILSGGSNIGIEIAISTRINLKHSQNLTIILADERFGPVNHGDSNWKQLVDGGFKFDNFNSVPVLTGSSVEDTAKQFETNILKAIDETTYVIALLGMGVDGHVAGLLPKYDWVNDQDSNIVSYQTGTHYRLTIGQRFFNKIDKIFLVSTGPEKKQSIENLQQNLPVQDYPAQLIKKAKSYTVYSIT